MVREKLIKKEVCHMFNTSKEFLRHYENKLLLQPETNDSKYRLYGHEEIQKIREILLLKELDFSIKEMQMINSRSIEKHDFLQLIRTHQTSLTKKIEQLMKTHNDVTQLLELLDTDETFSFLEKEYPERYYILTDSLQFDEYSTLKAYYDKYKDYIEDDSYSERIFQMIYNYNALKLDQALEGQVAVETDQKSDVCYTLQSGSYLSVFYPFEHGNFKDLKLVAKAIEDYLDKQDLKRSDGIVLEKEHPELSIFLDEGITIFELQLRIERKN